MSQRGGRSTPQTHGDVLTAISDGMVALLKEFYGRGPTRAKSYYEDDLVVCLLRGGFTRVEQTLLAGGRGSSVIQQRMEFQDLMRERFEAVIEDATGRQVIGFMSGNQQDPGHHVRGLHPRADRSRRRRRDRRIAGRRSPPDRRDRPLGYALDARSTVGIGGHPS